MKEAIARDSGGFSEPREKCINNKVDGGSSQGKVAL